MFVKFDLGSNSVPFLRTLKINAQSIKETERINQLFSSKDLGFKIK